MTTHLHWDEALQRFATPVGLISVSMVQVRGAPELPAEAKLWRAEYALLLAIPLLRGSSHEMKALAELGQEWLDAACIEYERQDGKVLDAYLVLVLDAHPPEQMANAVRDIELDPTSCRKHVAWRSNGTSDEDMWRRLLRVSILGLPESPIAGGMTNTPTLVENIQKELLTDIKSHGGRHAAKQHLHNPLNELGA